jgi:hypothetical protein
VLPVAVVVPPVAVLPLAVVVPRGHCRRRGRVTVALSWYSKNY